jgi:hypothetical protein
MITLQAVIKYEQDELSLCKALLDRCPSDDPDVLINYAAIAFKEGNFESARAQYSEVRVRVKIRVNTRVKIGVWTRVRFRTNFRTRAKTRVRVRTRMRCVRKGFIAIFSVIVLITSC